MKRLFFYIIIVFLNANVFAQSIPYGISIDTVQIIYSRTFYQNAPFSGPMIEMDTVVFTPFEIYYYKPINYDPLISPILWGVHGLGGNGSSEIGDLQTIADRRKALIVSATMQTNWPYCSHDSSNLIIPTLLHFYYSWYPDIFKQIYKHVLNREGRNSIPVHLIGFSAGGQCVSRYMLIRQGVPDSIPIKMAVSTNPANYTFCADTFNTIEMNYPCGLKLANEFNCASHIIQYYNENYAVLIGTADTAYFPPGWTCMDVQGHNRYERAQNFYAFSDSDAVVRGTTLKWQYGEVPGVDHNQNLMYNTILAGDSMPLAERLLFETTYHTIPQIAPYANFTVDTTIVSLPSATVQFFNNSIMAVSYLWDFGDSVTSTLFNPSHTYATADTFTVRLTANSGTGCENTIIKRNYIIVKNPNSVESYNYNNSVRVFPNPASGKIQVQSSMFKVQSLEIYNIQGQLIKSIAANNNKTIVDISALAKGMYFVKVKMENGIAVKKFVKE